MDHPFGLSANVGSGNFSVDTPCARCGVRFGAHLHPIAGGSAAVVPLVAALAPALIEEIPKIVASLMNLVNLVRNHPDTPQAVQDAFTQVNAHLDAASAAVAAVEI